jgi:hypothetical protein
MKLNTNNGINTINNGKNMEGNTMKNNNIETIKINKGILEIRKEHNAQGATIEWAYWNGQKFTILGYVSEEDRIASIKALTTVLENSDNMWEAAYKLMTEASLNEAKVEADEEIEVCSEPIFINRKKKEAYLSDGSVVADCKDIPGNLPIEAVKAILIPKIKAIFDDEE